MILRDKLKLALITKAKKKKEPIYCEYLESTGTQYINLGHNLNPKEAKRTIVMHVMWTDDFSERQAMLTNTSGYFEIRQSSGLYGLGSGVISDVKASTTSFDEIKFIQTPQMAGELFVNGKKLSERSIYGSGYDGDYIFALQYPPNKDSLNCKCKMASFQMYDKDDNLYMNLRPCLHPDTLEPCMYDTVKGEYHYNKGTEPFKYELSFTKLDYIESTGAQWIDTEFTQKQNIKIVTDLEFTKKTAETSWNDWYCVVGSRVGDARFNLIGNAKNSFHVAIGMDRTYGRTEINKKYHTETTVRTNTFDLSVNNEYMVKGQGVDVPTNEQSLYILGTHRQKVAEGQEELSKNLSFVKLYDALFYADNILARDYIPVRMNDGQIGLWDCIEGKFYANLGTEKLKGYLNGYQVGDNIKNAGDQYIDTGFVGSNETEVSCIFLLPRNSRGYFWNNYPYTSSYKITAFAPSGNNRFGKQTITSNPNYDIILKYKQNAKGLWVNGAEIGKYTPQTFKCVDTIKILRRDSGSSGAEAECHYFSLIEGTTIARALIPVKKDSFIGMIDTLTGKEYPNMGSGSFIFNE